MYYDQLNDLIWAGTTGEGLFCITPNRKIINYSFKDGLPDDNIVSIIPQKNKLYIGTYFGLSLFNPVEKTFSNIHTQQGISHNEFNSPFTIFIKCKITWLHEISLKKFKFTDKTIK